MSDTSFKPLIRAIQNWHGLKRPTGNLRLPRDPKRALADMQATLNDINEQKKERGWG